VVWSQYWGNERDNIDAPDEAVDGQGFDDGETVGEEKEGANHTLAKHTLDEKGNIMATKRMRKITRVEAFKLVRGVKESKNPVRFVKLEDVEEGEVYGVVTPDAGDATVKMVDGDLLVGPFSSPEEAREAMGDDVALVSGEGGGEVSEVPAGEEQVLIDKGMNESEKKVRSNLMRMRRNVVESLAARVKKDIQRESETLDVDTDVKPGQGSTEDAAGALDSPTLKGKVGDPKDTGPNALKGVDADQDPSAQNSDSNLLECSKGQFVKVVDENGKQVDSGIVSESTKAGFKLEGSDELYESSGKFRAVVLING
jgi:hypothetical protein